MSEVKKKIIINHEHLNPNAQKRAKNGSNNTSSRRTLKKMPGFVRPSELKNNLIKLLKQKREEKMQQQQQQQDQKEQQQQKEQQPKDVLSNPAPTFDKKKYENIFSKDFEESIYNFSLDYAESNNTPFLLENIYLSKADELYCLLKGDNLQKIVKAIKDGKIKPKNIAHMRQVELNLLLSNKQLVDIIKKRELNMMISEKKGSSAFECKKCKKEWDYKGKQKFYASCPDCKTSNKIEEKKNE
jgi:hypothetical protein